MARRRFFAEGYQSVTMRSIAAEAGVDAALISYFFGSKRGLFAAVMALETNPTQVLAEALRGDLDTLPERLLTALVETWDDAQRAAPMRLMFTTAATEPAVARLLREVIELEMIVRLAERIGGPDARARAGAATVITVGIIVQRSIIGLEPIASMPADELIARLAPLVRAALRLPPRRTPRGVRRVDGR